MPIAWGNRQEMHKQFPSWSDRVIEDYNCYLQISPMDDYELMPIPGQRFKNSTHILLSYYGNHRQCWFDTGDII